MKKASVRQSIRLLSRNSVKYFAVALLLFAGCRTITPIRDLHPALAPDISRVMLKGGTVVEFNKDFGWYNQSAGTIEGITVDSQHVEYHLAQLTKVETVRVYSLVAAVYTWAAVLGFAIYLLARLLALV